MRLVLVHMSCRHKAVMVCGILEMAMASSMLAAGVMAVLSKSWVAYTGHGLWGGCWVMTTGLLGTYGGYKRSRAMQVVFMGLNIVSAASIWLALAIISIWALIMDKMYSFTLDDGTDPNECPKDSVTWHGRKYDVYDCPNKVGVTSNLVILIASVLLLFSAILSAGLACFAVCRCCGATDTENVVEPEEWKPTTIQALADASKPAIFDITHAGAFDQEI